MSTPLHKTVVVIQHERAVDAVTDTIHAHPT
jgi:hypothetical protein